MNNFNLYFQKINTGQTVYEQLQEIVNKCIELGLYLDGCNFTIEYIYFNNKQLVVCNDVEGQESESIHWLFSKDSGLMEAVERDKSKKHIDYYYMIMGPMSAEEKVKYFIKNARVPTK